MTFNTMSLYPNRAKIPLKYIYIGEEVDSLSENIYMGNLYLHLEDYSPGQKKLSEYSGVFPNVNSGIF